MNQTLPAIKRVVQQRHLSGPTGDHSVRRQSGALKKSISFTRARLETSSAGGSSAVATFSISAPHAKIHIGKRGNRTVITPRRTRFLAIPTRFARKKNGVPIAGPSDPRWGSTFVIDSKSTPGNKIIMGRTGKTARSIRPLFTLARRVVVPQRIDIKRDIVQPAQQIFSSKLRQGLAKIL